jgi:ABC-type antimicrobial peptide transport system permease subunit
VGVRILSGRPLSAESEHNNEIVINEGLARRLWSGAAPLGKRIRFPFPVHRPNAPERPWLTIVGVAANSPTKGLTSDRTDPLVYFASASGTGNRSATVIVRARSGINPIADLRRLITSIDPYLGIANASSVASQLGDTVSRQRFVMVVLSVFATLAVVLSAIGLFGLLSFSVTQRTREIGVRIALGASPRRVAAGVVLSAGSLATIGVLSGLGASLWGARVLRTILYGIGPTDALSYVICAGSLLAVALVAAMIPARRATQVDPVVAMRAD